MPAKRMGSVRKNVTAPREKSQILKMFCNQEELEIINEYAKKGAVFIVLGSEYTDIREFYKGLYQIMYSPVSNGVCVYDSHYQYREASQRPHIVIGLNDPVNVNHLIDNIKLLDRYRSKTLYTVDYTAEEEAEITIKRDVAVTVLSMLGYKYHEEVVGDKCSDYNSLSLNVLKGRMPSDRLCQVIQNILLNKFLGGKPLTYHRLYEDEYGDVQPIVLSDLFENEMVTEKFKLDKRVVSFELRDDTEVEEFNEVLKQLGRNIMNNKEQLFQYLQSVSELGCFGYKCSRIININIHAITQSVYSDPDMMKELSESVSSGV